MLQCEICKEKDKSSVTFGGVFICFNCWKGLYELYDERYFRKNKYFVGDCVVVDRCQIGYIVKSWERSLNGSAPPNYDIMFAGTLA